MEHGQFIFVIVNLLKMSDYCQDDISKTFFPFVDLSPEQAEVVSMQRLTELQSVCKLSFIMV